MSDEVNPENDQPITDPAEFKRLQDALNILAKHPKLVHQLLNEEKEKEERRVNYSRRSRMSYYKAQYGLQAKAAIDAMMEDGEAREWRIADYKDLSKKTLYLRVNQSILYLCDEMDPEGKYKKFIKENVEVNNTKTGVRLSIVKLLHENEFSPSKVSEHEKRATWLDAVDIFLNESKVGGKPLHLIDLCLTPEEIAALNLQMQRPEIEENFMSIITHKEIKIVRHK